MADDPKLRRFYNEKPALPKKLGGPLGPLFTLLGALSIGFLLASQSVFSRWLKKWRAAK